MKHCDIVNLGRIDYARALDFQRDIFKKKHTTKVADTLVFAEHLPVYTCGRSADAQSLIKTELPKHTQLVKVDRGGSLTFHGPGQLMLYPIIKLPATMTLIEYIRKLEHLVIRALAVFGIKANSGEVSGVWVGDKKIGSIGIKVSSGITMHGLSLNVNCDLSYFEPILACGTTAKATSMQDILGYEIEISDVLDLLIINFGKEFNYRFSQLERNTDESVQQFTPQN